MLLQVHNCYCRANTRPHALMKTSGCRDGTLKNHAPNQMGMIAQYLHTIPTSCFVNYTYMLTVSLSTMTKLMKMVLHTAHSTAFRIKDNPYLPCSAALKFQGITCIHSNMPYMYRPLLLMHSTASAYKTDHICHVRLKLQSSFQHHNSLSMHINMHYRPSTAHHTASTIPII